MRVCAVIIGYGLLSGIVVAKESRSSLPGRVTDPAGAPIANAKLHATNHDGNFEIPFLIPGTYRLTVESAGFKKSVQTGIEVTVNDRIAADIALEG